MNLVKVHGIRTYSFHGCLEEETKIGGNYIINIDVFVIIRASNVPYVWANLISLENTDIEENIKSISATPIIILKNS